MEHVLVTLGIVLLIVAICREVTCWYFKFNAMVAALMTEIRDLLKTRPLERT
jgi:hypothetical protein